MKLVKVARVGSKVKEVALSDNATVSGALIAAGYTKEDNEDIFRNHILSSLGFPVSNNDIIILENKKMDPIKKKIIEILFEDGIVDYGDDNGSLDYAESDAELGDTIDEIIAAVRS